MKNVIAVFLIYSAYSIKCFCQQLPDDIASTLDKLRAETILSLEDIRINPKSRGFHVGLIQWALPEDQFVKAEKLKLKLDLGMIYDNEMRNRLLQLLKNEYRPEELDTLVNRLISKNIEGYKIKVIELSGLDTMQIFKKTLDSIKIEVEKSQDKSFLYPYQYTYKVLKILKIDTLTIFRLRLDSLLEKAKEEAKKRYLYDDYTDLSSIAELCGYVNDQRFVKPLIEALNKPKKFQKNVVIEALARMKVEPYYTNLLKDNTHSMNEVISGIDIDYTIYTNVLRSQDSFLELSKYLKSNAECLLVSDESKQRRHGDELKFCVFEAIYNNLENLNMKSFVGNGVDKIHVPYEVTPEIDSAVEKLYDWMQKNYGTYEITWYHY